MNITNFFHRSRAHRLLAGASALALGLAGSAQAATFSIPNGDVAALKRAIKAAGANAQADTISLAPNGLYTLAQVDNTLSGPNGLPLVEPDGGARLTIAGNGATLARSAVAGTPSFRLAFLRRGAVVSISALTMRNGTTTDWGGLINNESTLSMERCSMLGSASANGGAIVNFGPLLSMVGCTVSGNRARFGGGITNYARLNISNSTISSNIGTGAAGGIDNTYGGTLNAQSCLFSNNRSDLGGAMSNFLSSATIVQSTFSGNVATNRAGGLFNDGSLTLDRCTLSGNTAPLGAGLVHAKGAATLRQCVVSANKADFGGGITNYGGLNILNSTISGNSAVNVGGGIDNAFRAPLNVQNSLLSNNKARSGAGLHNFGATATLFQCTISGNIASDRGAGAFNVGGEQNGTVLRSAMTLRACTVTLNRAAQGGGGLDNIRGAAPATLSVRSTIVAGNVSTRGLAAGVDLNNGDILQNAGFNLIGGASGLAPLANNGGPTLSHALLPTSRAINAGDTAPGTPFDQRGAGFVRVRGGRADIGAFESQQALGPSPTPTPTLAPTATPAPTLPPLVGLGQVRDAATGHVYELVRATVTWDQARAAASGRTLGGVRGHLATITSQAEQDLVAQLRGAEGEVEGWLGGVQPAGGAEPAGGFAWITGESFGFTRWRSGEPNNAPNDLGSEDAILFTVQDNWNDVPRRLPIGHFFVEYESSIPTARATRGPHLLARRDDSGGTRIARVGIRKPQSAISFPFAMLIGRDDTVSEIDPRRLFLEPVMREALAKLFGLARGSA